MTLTELAIKRPSIIVVIFSVLGTLGIFSYIQLKYELLPKITPPVIVVSTVYPGASPNEIESDVSKPIEDALSTLDKISAIHTTSSEGISFVNVEFDQSANIDFVLQDAQRKISAIQATLPTGAKSPVLSKIALDEIPIIRMGATSSLPTTDFYQFVKDRIQPSLSNVPGVGQVTIVGGEEREIKVNLDAEKLRAYGLSILQVTQMIKASNLDFPTGNVKDADRQFVVRIAGKFKSVDDLRRLIVGKSRQGGNVMLGDIGEVEDGKKDFTTASRINGVTSLGIIIQKQSDANAVEVSKLVRAKLNQLEKDYADKKVKFDIAQDSSTFTIEAADAVQHDLMVAICLVAIVMFLFLHSIRNSLIVMIAIPTSLISTLTGIYLFGFTLNLMVLLAMSLVIGILVDDSIVVLENIYHHLEKGEERRVAALKGRNEIGFAALSITLVDVVVFVPLTLISGLIGNIVREYAMVIVFSTLLSLFVSFTVTPLLASRFAKIERLTKGTLLGKLGIAFESFYHWLTEEYRKVLPWALQHRWTVMIATSVLFFSSISLLGFGFIGFEFMTQTDRGEFTVTLELPPGSTVEQTNTVTQQVERAVSEMPEVKKIFANVGTSTEGLIGQSSTYVSELNIALVPRNQRSRSTDAVGAAIKNYALKIPGVKVRINPIGIFGTANQTPIVIFIRGVDLDSVYRGANLVTSLLRRVPGAADIRLSAEEGKPETRIEIDREKMANLGLTVADVGSALRIALSGDDDSKFRDGPNEFTLRIRLDEFDRSRTSDVGSLTFMNQQGKLVELKQFAKIYQTSGPTKLQREDRTNAVTAYSQVIGRPIGSVVQDFRDLLAKEHLPKGVSISYSGDQKNMADSFISLSLALVAAILFVYLIMVALYDSYLYPFVVLFSIPVAIVGALFALALTMNSLSTFSFLGIIMLVGLVAKNAILLVDRANQMQIHGMSISEAIQEAGQARLRPILMTTLAMVFGMLPIALGGGASSEWKSGLAWALVGGLTSSMLLTLIVVPIVYVKMDEWRVIVPAFLRKTVRGLKPVPKKETAIDAIPASANLRESI
ncbi:MAG: efflux RND transporter permease subunit [Bacteroidota bacterium]